MPQSLAQVYLHIVFSTKERVPFLSDKELLRETHRYLAGACRNLDSPALIVGGVEDDEHILCRLSRKYVIADLVQELKKESSKWLKRRDSSLMDFHWQGGYGAFSVSPAHVPALRQYIATQEEHHQKESFQDEFRRFLDKYGIDYDQRYVWD